MRRRGAMLAACLLLTGCTSGHDPSPTKEVTASHSQQPSHRTTDALKCDDYVDSSQAPPVDFEVALGVVALPTSPSSPALQTSHSGEGRGPLRLFAKTGLVIKSGTNFELIVPARVANRPRIRWGEVPPTPGHRVVISNCASPLRSRWLAYVGGYWINRPACVPLIVKVGDREQKVHIGLGAPCPGQRPPQGPSDQ